MVVRDDEIIGKAQTDRQETKKEFAFSPGQRNFVFQRFTENISLNQGPQIIQTRNIGGSVLIWGNVSLGVWGSYVWGSSPNSSFYLGNLTLGILGQSKLGSTASSWDTVRIVNPSDTWTEMVRDTRFMQSVTGGSWDTTNHRWRLTGGTLETSPVVLNDGTLSNAKVIFDEDNLTTGGTTNYYFQPVVGGSWYSATNNTLTNFTTGGTGLRFKITQTGGTWQYDIEDDIGKSHPIKIQYSF